MATFSTPNMSRLFQTAGQGQQPKGTGYTNLSKLIGASADNTLGQKVVGGIQQQLGGVQQQLTQQQKQFQEESEKSKLGGEKDVQQREAVLGRFSPSSATAGEGPSEDELKAFERFRGGQYAGPSGLGDTTALKQTAQQIQQQASNLTPSGTQELLRRSVGGDRYTQGQQRLDSLLLNRQALTPVTRQASGLTQQITKAEQAATGQAQLQKNLAEQFAKETQEKLGGALTGIETGVQQQLTAAQEAEKQRQANIQAIQNFAANRVPKLDEAGNVVKDQYGNVVYDTAAQARGSADQFQQIDYLKNILTQQGAQAEELEKLFGKSGGAEAQSVIQKRTQAQSDLNAYQNAAKLVEEAKHRTSPYWQGEVAKARRTMESIAPKYGISAGADLDTIYSGSNYNPAQASSKVGSFITSIQQPYIQGAGVLGQAVVGGQQEDFYKNLAAALANAPQAQNLTEQGVASAAQRANYEALAKLMGQTTPKYTTGAEQYQAGKFLLNPDQIKRSLGY